MHFCFRVLLYLHAFRRAHLEEHCRRLESQVEATSSAYRAALHDLGRRVEELHASEHQLKEKNELVRRLRARLRETLDIDHEQVKRCFVTFSSSKIVFRKSTCGELYVT